jgi:hypothetical protein
MKIFGSKENISYISSLSNEIIGKKILIENNLPWKWVAKILPRSFLNENI